MEEDVETLSDEIQRDLETVGQETKTYEGTLETASETQIEAEATIARLPAQADADHDFVGIVRDVTERNKRERQLERQNERLDSFARMVAHELRNPLMIGQMYCRELPEEANSETVAHITEAFDRIEDIIDVMLVVTHGYETIPEQQTVDLAAAARDAWDNVVTTNATLEVLVEGTVQADETYLEHLFRNLFENAIEHGGSNVTVTVGEFPTGFYVADDGTGIPVDNREAVFEMGYTTAASHGGMGLGLAFVQELADIYGWTCTVTESVTGGARIEFTNVTESQGCGTTESHDNSYTDI